MTTNINIIPQLTASFSITTDADWRDAIGFFQSGSPTENMYFTGAITSGNNVITGVPVSVTNLLASGMTITGPNIPGSTTIVGIPYGGGSIILSANATGTGTFGYTAVPIILDLTGIDFEADVRPDPNSGAILSLSTAAGTLINGGATGTLTFAVPAATMSTLEAGTYYMDILAIDSVASITRNLFENAPATVVILHGYTY